MEVYQAIYTSVRNSLADEDLGLVNGPGLKVYSCSKGLTKQNLDEITKFCSYRLPKNNKKEFSQLTGDPEVPEMFPKIFRTLRLSDGKLVAIQSVFAGVDHQGQEGNFFAHVLIFDDYDNDFIPERYYKNAIFKTHLTADEAENENVPYLPMLDAVEVAEDFDKKVYDFIAEHKKELSHIINGAINVLTEVELSNLCIVSADEEKVAMYLIALKYLLPRDMEENLGISTYNVYLPSNRQKKIVFHGSIKGQNNITADAIEYRKNCIYVDMDKTNFDEVKISPLIEKWTPEELREEFSQIKIKSTEGLLSWVISYENETRPGMGSKLLYLKTGVGEAAFVKRACEVYPKLKYDEYQDVRFEVIKVMYDHIDYFKKHFASLVEEYIDITMQKLCEGESYDLGNMFSSKLNEKLQVAELKKHIDKIVEMCLDEDCKITDKNKFVLLGFFAYIKQKFGAESWKDFFGGKKDSLTLLVEFGAKTVVTGYGTKPFSPPLSWTDEDLAEFVALLEASTENKAIGDVCLKYIYANDNVDWERLGVVKTKHKKTKSAQEADIQKIQSMLRRVGYEPYQNGKYTDLVNTVHNEMQSNIMPLLMVRVLHTFYQWQKTYGNQVKAKAMAEKLRDLIMELRKTQPKLYDYMIPKLALEIVESQGHYHEIIINMDTMYDAFWNWFLIGYKKCRRDDEKALNYSRVYGAISKKISRLPMRKKLRAAFADQQ